MWRGGSNRGVEGDIGSAVLSRSGRDVAASLTIRSGECPTATLFAGYTINGVLQTPGGKRGADFDFVAAFPPTRVE
jgi:hypothetical protein